MFYSNRDFTAEIRQCVVFKTDSINTEKSPQFLIWRHLTTNQSEFSSWTRGNWCSIFFLTHNAKSHVTGELAIFILIRSVQPFLKIILCLSYAFKQNKTTEDESLHWAIALLSQLMFRYEDGTFPLSTVYLKSLCIFIFIYSVAHINWGIIHGCSFGA